MGTLKDEVQLQKYCEICKKVTDWEDGFNIETGVYIKWLLCVECDDRKKGGETIGY